MLRDRQSPGSLPAHCQGLRATLKRQPFGCVETCGDSVVGGWRLAVGGKTIECETWSSEFGTPEREHVNTAIGFPVFRMHWRTRSPFKRLDPNMQGVRSMSIGR